MTFSSDMRVTTIDMFFRLGITQHFIRFGIVRLEEVRDGRGALVNLYIRVSETSGVCYGTLESVMATHQLIVSRLFTVPRSIGILYCPKEERQPEDCS